MPNREPAEVAIHWNSDLGKWMATVAFKFDEREKEMKIL